jgi:hypothetical protein
MSRSPSPQPGGWSSPGLNTPYDSGGRASPFANGSSSHNVTWASAQARSAEVKGYPGFNPRGQSFLGKHFRRISTSLPFSYAEKEKLGRGRFQGNKLVQTLNRIGRKGAGEWMRCNVKRSAQNNCTCALRQWHFASWAVGGRGRCNTPGLEEQCRQKRSACSSSPDNKVAVLRLLLGGGRLES